MASSKSITLISSDKKSFELNVNAARHSDSIVSLIKNGRKDTLKFSEIDSVTLERVVSFLKYHEKNAITHDWDRKFLSDLDGEQFMELAWAAQHLKIHELIEITKDNFKSKLDTLAIEGMRDEFSINVNHEERRYLADSFP
jgi:hypothetical protein